MGKRLFMTSADYVAIAISPALIMALVGSLVFFLIEVLYVGEYAARLNYAFALFVFAAVLVARIAIEMGSERAALFALPLGLAMFAVLARFVDHPSPLSPLINLALLGIVWWCAHQLTWDSTVIDDAEDASGEGLMQQIKIDGADAAEPPVATEKPLGGHENELVAAEAPAPPKPWWQRLGRQAGAPHTPGMWVLYFSLAALPLFGFGQHWIAVGDVARRRYAFTLLLVYVAAALALLVTTSFLNLRRYLRQRRIEMPLSIAGTWVGTGVVLILLVMFAAALIPRPSAEIALSRVPWQASAPEGLSPSRRSLQRDGAEPGESESAAAAQAVAEEGESITGTQLAEVTDGAETNDASQGEAAAPDDASGQGRNADSAPNTAGQSETSGSQSGEGSETAPKSQSSRSDPSGESSAEGREDPTASNGGAESAADAAPSETAGNAGAAGDSQGEPDGEPESPLGEIAEHAQANDPPPNTSSESNSSRAETPSPPSSPIEALRSRLGSLGAMIKLLLYLVAAILIAWALWRYRRELLQAITDLLSELRAMFAGGRGRSRASHESEESAKLSRRRRFADFCDPFQGSAAARFVPEELVRYTFEAFEAWANDRGTPRTLDCTPQELVSAAVEPRTPMHAEARRLVRLYNQVAYGGQRVPRETTAELRTIWQLMRSTTAEMPAESAR